SSSTATINDFDDETRKSNFQELRNKIRSDPIFREFLASDKKYFTEYFGNLDYWITELLINFNESKYDKYEKAIKEPLKLISILLTKCDQEIKTHQIRYSKFTYTGAGLAMGLVLSYVVKYKSNRNLKSTLETQESIKIALKILEGELKNWERNGLNYKQKGDNNEKVEFFTYVKKQLNELNEDFNTIEEKDIL
ncbi:7744_t:CDS:2, partial [Diversispora eburnea]